MVAYPCEGASAHAVDFDGAAWRDYVPIRLAGTVAVRDRLPAGTTAVLVNRNHTDSDLYLPVDARESRMLEAIDGRRNVAEIAALTNSRPEDACDFFQRLWRWDQVVFDTSGG